MKARFWNFPKAIYDDVELIYDSNSKLSKDQHEVWETAIESAHNKVIADMISTPKGKKAVLLPVLKHRFRKPIEDITTSNTGCSPLGSHPQGFYTIWVTEADRKKIKDLGYSFDTHLPAKMTNISSYLVQNQDCQVPQMPNNDVKTTATTIKESKITAAGNWPRCKTQSAIMNNISATEVRLRCSAQMFDEY